MTFKNIVLKEIKDLKNQLNIQIRRNTLLENKLKNYKAQIEEKQKNFNNIFRDIL